MNTGQYTEIINQTREQNKLLREQNKLLSELLKELKQINGRLAPKPTPVKKVAKNGS